MKISTRGRYSLRLMIDLAENEQEGFITLRDIAERQDISRKYLELEVTETAYASDSKAIFAVLLGSYSIPITVAGIPSLYLLKSMILYFLLAPPPRCLTVILP